MISIHQYTLPVSGFVGSLVGGANAAEQSIVGKEAFPVAERAAFTVRLPVRVPPVKGR